MESYQLSYYPWELIFTDEIKTERKFLQNQNNLLHEFKKRKIHSFGSAQLKSFFLNQIGLEKNFK